MRKLKHQTGFGLLELMLSMVIVALLLIMATRYYQSARSNARVNEAVSLIAAIDNAANNIAIGGGNYKSITSVTVLASYLPANAAAGISPWGGSGSLTVAAATDPTTLTITMTGTGADCDKLQTALSATQAVGSYSKYTCDGSGTFTATESMSALEKS